jgi:hypothetical protein
MADFDLNNLSDEDLAKLSGRQLLTQALRSYSSPYDVNALNQMAQQRQQQYQQSLINSLAAGLGGKRMEPVRDVMLKQAMSNYGDQDIGGGYLSGGKFVEDPYAARKRQYEALTGYGKEIFDVEQQTAKDLAADKRQAEREAAADRRQADREAAAAAREEARYKRMSDPGYVTPGERQQSTRRLMTMAQQADASRNALEALPSMKEAMKNAPQGFFGPVIQKVANIASSAGFSRAEKLAAGGQLADAIATQFGIAKLSDIGGNDTDKELMAAISTTYNGKNLPEVNRKLVELYERVAKRNVNKFNNAQRWASKYGSIFKTDEKDKTFDESYAPTVIDFTSNNFGNVPEGAVRRK